MQGGSDSASVHHLRDSPKSAEVNMSNLENGHSKR